MGFLKRKSRLDRQLALGDLQDAMGRVQAPAPRYELTHAPNGTTDHLVPPGAAVTLCHRERGADWHPGGGHRPCGLCKEISERDSGTAVAP